MDIASTYKGYIKHKKLFIALLAVIAVITAIITISAGSANLSIGEVLMTLIGRGSEKSRMIVFNIRLPRTLTAIIAGVGLSTVGCAMQSLLKNPLASSSTLGISQGAAFGASFAIIALGAGVQNATTDAVTFTNPYVVSICAFVSAMASTFVILALSKLKNMSSQSMILSGVALSAMFQGGTALLQYFATDVKVAAVVFWTFGDLGRTSWREIIVMAVVVTVALVYFQFNRWNFNALQSGEENAKGLGVNVELIRIIGMLVCALTASVIVSFVGTINFIGLIAPHLVRRFIGGDHRYLIPASALMGAVLLLLSDTFARLAVAPIVMPIGAITSLLGAPLFIYFIFKGGRRR